MCACMMRCPILRAGEHGLAPAPAVMFSTLESLVDVRCSDVRRTERYRTDKWEGLAQAQVHTGDSVGAKAGHDAPWRKTLSVNSTTSRRTPPPGASRSTFGTKPLYSAAGPSSRKIVTSLRARGVNGSRVDKKPDEDEVREEEGRRQRRPGMKAARMRMRLRRVCPVVLGNDAGDLACSLYA